METSTNAKWNLQQYLESHVEDIRWKREQVEEEVMMIMKKLTSTWHTDLTVQADETEQAINDRLS